MTHLDISFFQLIQFLEESGRVQNNSVPYNRDSILSENSGAGLKILYSSKMNVVVDTIIRNNADGMVFGSTDLQDQTCLDNSVRNVTCINNSRFGVLIENSLRNIYDKITLTGNRIGISIGDGGNVTSMERSNIHGNSVAAVDATANSDLQFTAVENYWGDPLGPYHEFLTPHGIGDTILGDITFIPWSAILLDLDDHTPPPAPTNLAFDRVGYFDPSSNISYFKYGETYTISVHGPSIHDDPGLSHLEFHAWGLSHTEYDVSDNNYSYQWTVEWWYPDEYIYVLAYDTMGNGASSDVIRINVVASFLDLTISNISFSDPTPGSGENISITVTVHAEVFMNGTANNVKTKMFMIDGDGNQEFLGEIEFGDLDPSVDGYPDDPLLGPGDFQGTLFWITPGHFYHGENGTYVIKAQVDPDGYVREKLETNNEAKRDVTVEGLSTGPPEVHFSDVTRFGGWHDLRFNILVTSTVRVMSVEYRFNGSEAWRHAYSSFGGDEWSQGISDWYFELNTSGLVPGDYSFELKVYDGLYHADPSFGDFQVLSEPSDEDGDEDTDFARLYIIISVVVMLILILIQQAMKNAQSSHPSGSTVPEAPVDNTGKKDPSGEGMAGSMQDDSEVKCEHCGTAIPDREWGRSIRITCPECGEDSVNEGFRGEDFKSS